MRAAASAGEPRRERRGGCGHALANQGRETEALGIRPGVDVDAAAAKFEGVDGVALLRQLPEIPADVTTASMRGRIIEYSPGSSNRMITAVMGARAAPPNTAPIPTSANAPGVTPRPRRDHVEDLAKRRTEHRAQEQRRPRTRRRSLRSDCQRRGNDLSHDSIIRNPTAYLPPTAFWSTGYPTPYISGRTRKRPKHDAADGGAKPLRAPPEAVREVLDAVEHLGERGRRRRQARRGP